jgi:hypothetical protein
VNKELEAARGAWQQAVNEAMQIGADRANDPAASEIADDKFTKLLDELREGDVAARINETVKASSTNAVGDVRSVSGAGQLTSLINRTGEVSRRQLAALQQIVQNTSTTAPKQLVNI